MGSEIEEKEHEYNYPFSRLRYVATQIQKLYIPNVGENECLNGKDS